MPCCLSKTEHLQFTFQPLSVPGQQFQASCLGLALLVFALLWPNRLYAEVELISEGQKFSHYRFYFQFEAPMTLQYRISPYGNSKLLQAWDSAQTLVIVSRTLRLTEEVPSGQFLKPPGCAELPDFKKQNGSVRCESVEDGVPLIRLIRWENTAGLMHLFAATVQKEDRSILDSLEQSLQPQPAFYYPDDGL